MGLQSAYCVLFNNLIYNHTLERLDLVVCNPYCPYPHGPNQSVNIELISSYIMSTQTLLSFNIIGGSITCRHINQLHVMLNANTSLRHINLGDRKYDSIIQSYITRNVAILRDRWAAAHLDALFAETMLNRDVISRIHHYIAPNTSKFSCLHVCLLTCQ